MVNETDVVCVSPPLVPPIVSANVPLGELYAVCTVSVDVVPVVLFGLKLPVAPVGRPLTDKATAPANPPVLVSVTV